MHLNETAPKPRHNSPSLNTGEFDSVELLHFFTADELAAVAGCSVRTIRRWRAAGTIPQHVARAAGVLLAGWLGAIHPAWRGYRVLRSGELAAPGGVALKPGEIAAVPVLRQQVRALEAELAQARRLLARKRHPRPAVTCRPVRRVRLANDG